MTMKRSESPVASTRRQPLDDDPEWQAIYDALVAILGEPKAWSWFAHCRFIGLSESTLTLSHWGAFQAAECLKRHGTELAKAAGVGTVVVHRTGGYRPSHMSGLARQHRGAEIYRRPSPAERQTTTAEQSP